VARVCGLLHLAVSSYYYQSHGRRDEAPVRSALRRHAEVRRRWGYRRLLVLLRRDGIPDNHKRVYRLYREERGCRPGRGDGWGDSFQGGPNRPRPRSGGAAGGAARESENDPVKKDVPPWRRCPEERERLAATTACSAAGALHAATESTCGRVRPEKFRNGLARLGTMPSHDTAGPDDLRQGGRTPRSMRLASGKSDRVTPRWGWPGPAALGPSARSGCAGVA